MEGISIIIPVYNKLEITLRCIEHIRKMNRKGVAEIIIVDNGSTDATPVMLSKQSDIAYIRSLENLGIAKAFNCAAENAKGDIFCFMHNMSLSMSRNGLPGWQHLSERPLTQVLWGSMAQKCCAETAVSEGGLLFTQSRMLRRYEDPLKKVAVVDGLLLAMRPTGIHGYRQISRSLYDALL